MSYTTVVVADSPVSFWLLGEASSASPAADVMGLNPGSYGGSGTTFLQTGPVGISTAILLNGSGWMEVPDHASLDLGDGPLSVECWFKTTDTDFNLLGSKGDTAGNASFTTYVLPNASSNKVRCDKEGSSTIVDTTSTGLNDGVWHHYVYTKNGAANKAYIDGADVTGAVTNATLNSNNEKLGWGTRFINGAESGTTIRLVGSITAPAIYGSVLSAARVLVHYRTGTTVPLPENLAPVIYGRGAC